ncbi:MAG: hypothetical protein A2X34_03390 [Elusimicrobia bacterium GWC2_51_8]|nr:MAG: hypothetical protein A2X33_07245 [Elusimicrobia bacterium GWA2_51_34]OGR59441.1 MAG: hypothetical protein A2X34_03390 [Elusimicrobia bacterium GWC2_51_8]OGR84777.1 MAG: hypothetical protein A2021_08455 [Elusimicrobia bacterium GWF2_52_66]HAF95305.1 hypothetical protein [Elusimicrobiota bacterium]HCE96923.1 hypothetical protein [Elusimicrobiota bacterium]
MEAGNKTLKTLFVLSAAAIFFSGAAVLDLRARAKSAWLTAERYSEWQRRPEIKKLYFHDIYAKKTIALKKSGMAPEKLEKELSGLETEKDFLIHESSAKYAYIWYKTASSAFCRPENKWCALAREKLGAAKNSWKTELRSKNIKFEDWMVD